LPRRARGPPPRRRRRAAPMASGGETVKTQEAAKLYRTLLEQTAVPEQKQVIVTADADCTAPGALDALAHVTYAEAAALLQANALGVQRFFEEKGCADIGRTLAEQGVSGHSLHMLSPANIERDLGGLNLGQQLAMKSLLSKLRFVAKTQQRRDEIWAADEYFEVVSTEQVEGCCWAPEMLRWLVRAPPAKGTVRLPAERYSLTEAVLRVVRSGWVDGSADKERAKELVPRLGCASCCGYQEVPDPQYKVSTDNIDLSCIEDVDSFAYSAQNVRRSPDWHELWLGYEAQTVMQPAEVIVTYVERGGDPADEPGRRQLRMKVDPSSVEDVAQKIIAAKEEAQDATRGHADFASGFGSPTSVRSARSAAASPARRR